jgi:hypothetical protein
MNYSDHILRSLSTRFTTNLKLKFRFKNKKKMEKRIKKKNS